jgi:hypothetical protein
MCLPVFICAWAHVPGLSGGLIIIISKHVVSYFSRQGWNCLSISGIIPSCFFFLEILKSCPFSFSLSSTYCKILQFHFYEDFSSSGIITIETQNYLQQCLWHTDKDKFFNMAKIVEYNRNRQWQTLKCCMSLYVNLNMANHGYKTWLTIDL